MNLMNLMKVNLNVVLMKLVNLIQKMKIKNFLKYYQLKDKIVTMMTMTTTKINYNIWFENNKNDLEYIFQQFLKEFSSILYITSDEEYNKHFTNFSKMIFNKN